MQVSEFISGQESPDKELVSSIHQIVVENDKKANAEVGKMMGREMIIYKCSGNMKYALSAAKSHMSLHVMPMYGSIKIHAKYKKLLGKAKFQKGCINFKTPEEMPATIITELIKDCAKIDLKDMKAVASDKKAIAEWIAYHKKQD